MTPQEASGFIASNHKNIKDPQICVVWWTDSQCCITLGLDGKYCHIELGDAAGSVLRGVVGQLESHVPPAMEKKMASVREQIDAILGTKPPA